MAHRNPTPPEQLLTELVRMKATGVNFEHAWRVATGRVNWGHERTARDDWKKALKATRLAWHAAYHDTGPSISTEALMRALIHETDLEDDEQLLVTA